MTQGDKVKYIGKGFLCFNEENPYAEYVESVGDNDAYIKYEGIEVLVYNYEIERVAK